MAKLIELHDPCTLEYVDLGSFRAVKTETT